MRRWLSLVELSVLAGCSAGTSHGPASVAPPEPARVEASPPVLQVDVSVAPAYPEALLRVGLSGRAVVRIPVTASGIVDTLGVATSDVTNQGFLPGIRKTIAGWHFLPAREDGQPVPGLFEIAVRFRAVPCDSVFAEPPAKWMADSAPRFVEVVGCFHRFFPRGGEGWPAVRIPAWPTDSTPIRVRRRFPPGVPICGTATPVLDPDSIGPIPLRHGITLTRLQSICPKWYPTWTRLEGHAVPLLLVTLGRADVALEMSGTQATSTLFRVSTRSTNARSADGVGPGVGAAEVARRWAPVEFGSGEGGLYMTSRRRPWISLAVSLPRGTSAGLEARLARTNNWRLLPAGAKVSEVLLSPTH